MGAGTGKSHQNFKVCGHLAGANFVSVSPGLYVTHFSTYIYIFNSLKMAQQSHTSKSPVYTAFERIYTLCIQTSVCFALTSLCRQSPVTVLPKATCPLESG